MDFSKISREELEGYLDTIPRSELNALLEQTDSWKTRYDSKFHLYEPTIIATHFHASPARFRAHFGGNRSSKTYSHIIDYAIQFTGEVPRSLVESTPEGGSFGGISSIPAHRLERGRRLRFCMEDYPNAFMKVIWPYIQQLVPDDQIADVIREGGFIKAITNKWGGFIEFMFYSQDVMKFAGSSRHSIAYDEEPPEDIHRENMMRIVDTDGEMTFSLTPVSGALKFLYDQMYGKRGREVEKDWEFTIDKHNRLVDAKPGKLRDIEIPGGDPNIHCFFSSIFDNPVIKKEAAISILSEYPKEEAIVRGKGHFLFLSGLVYKEYSDSSHLIDRGLWWCNGPLSSDCTLYIAIDPHPRTPHAILYLVKQKNGPMFIVDELFVECTAKQLAQEMWAKCRGKIPEVILMDPLAWTQDPISHSDMATEFMKELSKLGCPSPVVKASKDRANGIMETRRILECKDTGRVDDDGDPIMAPDLYVMDHCSRFRYEITHWAWDDWAKSLSKGEKQVPIDKDDHMMENMYRLMLLDPQYKRERTRRGEESEPRPNLRRGIGRNPVTGY